MGQFKFEGDPFLTLAEEMAEAIQVIMKKYRFDSDWDIIPVGKDKSRWEMLSEEMQDVMDQWERCKGKKPMLDAMVGPKVIGKIDLSGDGPSQEDMQADAEYMHSMEVDEDYMPEDEDYDNDQDCPGHDNQ